MRLSIAAVAVAALSVSAPAAAINKCIGADGRVVFQDTPCTGKSEKIEVRPASGSPPGAVVSRPAASAAISEAQRLEGLVAASQRQRRAQELRERVLPGAEQARSGHRAACEQKQKDLAAQQYAYQQNLYGKTHAAQIASEMAAAAATCETKDRELKETIESLTKECTALKCRI